MEKKRGGKREGAGRKKGSTATADQLRALILHAAQRRHPEFLSMDIRDLLREAVKCLPKEVDANINLRTDGATLTDLLKTYKELKSGGA